MNRLRPMTSVSFAILVVLLKGIRVWSSLRSTAQDQIFITLNCGAWPVLLSAETERDMRI